MYKRQRRIQDLAKHLWWTILKNLQRVLAVNYFRKIYHLGSKYNFDKPFRIQQKQQQYGRLEKVMLFTKQ